MSDNVVALREVNSVVDAEVVEHLEHLLDEAKEGRLRGVAYIGVLDGRQVGSGWAGEAVDDNVFVVLGSLVSLQARFIRTKALGEPS